MSIDTPDSVYYNLAELAVSAEHCVLFSKPVGSTEPVGVEIGLIVIADCHSVGKQCKHSDVADSCTLALIDGVSARNARLTAQAVVKLFKNASLKEEK